MSSDQPNIGRTFLFDKCPVSNQNVRRRTACSPDKMSGEGPKNFVYSAEAPWISWDDFWEELVKSYIICLNVGNANTTSATMN